MVVTQEPSAISPRQPISRVSVAAAIVVIIIGAAVLTGWALDVDWLRRLPPDPIVMLPNTSVGFMMGGLALWLLRREDAPRNAERIGRALGTLVLLLGLISFIERVTGLDAGIDRLLFVEEYLSRQGKAGLESPAAPSASDGGD